VAVAAIALGSNLLDPAANVGRAIQELAALGTVLKRSALHESKPWGVEDQPDFINAVVLLETALTPRELLNGLKKIEATMGRTPTYKWGPRLIDLDIIYYDDLVVDEPDLKIPHPHFREREFVLEPLAEVDERFRRS
jgi:2-amino-4-hydroxy-6-hydroxymethyldihydropteridine diphosphokinase